MPLKILCFDELGLTKIDTFSRLYELDIMVVNVKDRNSFFDALNNNYFSAFICVINSEAMKEFDYVKKLKQKNEYKETPVIIISRFAERKCILKAVEVGAQEYIAKPYNEDVLIGKIFSVLGLQQHKYNVNSIMEDDIVTFSFSEMFNKEVKAASRGNYPLSVVLLAVVHPVAYKSRECELNEITVNLHKVVKTKLRDTDSIFLFGTGKLAILLPFADNEGVKVVENKIKDVFSNHTIMKKVTTEYQIVTGAVSFPEDGKIQSKLLEKLKSSLEHGIGQITTNAINV